MVRKAFLLGPSDLIPTAERLATDVEPWATRVECNVEDYLAAGLGGEKCKIPIRKHLPGDAWKRPVWSEVLGAYIAWDEESKKLPPLTREEQVHVVFLEPSRDCQPGEIRIAVDHG